MIELEILIEFDRICRDNDISYSLDGGTLLGAVRHRGFIPWDDDVDVIMLRTEYLKFKKAAEKELDRERFFLQDHKTDPGYHWGYSKIRREGTSFVRNGQSHLKQHDGIFIDIFIVDSVPDDSFLKKIHYAKCFYIRKGLYSKIGKDNEKSLFYKILYKILSIPGKDYYLKKLDKLIKKSNSRNNQSKLVSHYTYGYPKSCRYGMPRECFLEMTDMLFEGHLFKAFTKYDTYLGLLYGDYMKLPPKDKQKPHIEAEKIVLL